MAINVLFFEDVRARILAGAILAVASADGNVEYIRGVLALAQHQVVGLGLSWTEFAKDAKRELGVDNMALLDSALVSIEE